MRTLLLFALLTAGCLRSSPSPTPTSTETETTVDDNSVKKPGNLPVMTESELAAEDAERQKCIEACVQRNQARAVSADQIQHDCERECMQEVPIRQVEVAPDPIRLEEP